MLNADAARVQSPQHQSLQDAKSMGEKRSARDNGAERDALAVGAAVCSACGIVLRPRHHNTTRRGRIDLPSKRFGAHKLLRRRRAFQTEHPSKLVETDSAVCTRDHAEHKLAHVVVKTFDLCAQRLELARTSPELLKHTGFKQAHKLCEQREWVLGLSRERDHVRRTQKIGCRQRHKRLGKNARHSALVVALRIKLVQLHHRHVGVAVVLA
mmetsp:Transcript_4904/g.13171  ORF Transcript_4904/g.13171 Transcript_4904/m.13171 type:complete len:211 (+) Transcript_4904:1686-2318(+)